MANRVLRRLRESTPSLSGNGRAMTRAELAAAVNEYVWATTGTHCHLEAHTLARYERGLIRWPSAVYRNALRAVLGAESDAGLGFYPTARGRAASRVTDLGDKEADEQTEELNGLDEFTAWLHRANAVDAVTIANLAAETERLRTGDPCRPSQDSRSRVDEHVETLWSLRSASLNGAARERLASVVSDAATLAGWIHLDAGNLREAWRLHEYAKDAARESPVVADLAHAIAQQAYVLIDIDRPDDAAQLAGQAIDIAGSSVSPVMRSWLYSVAGEAAAVIGDRDVSLRHFDRAAMVLSHDGREEDAPYIVLDDYGLARWRGSALARMGEESAIADLHYALTGMDPGHLRAGAQLNVDLASALTAAGHRDDAHETLLAAEHLARRAGSLRQQRRIRDLRRRLRSHSGEPRQ